MKSVEITRNQICILEFFKEEFSDWSHEDDNKSFNLPEEIPDGTCYYWHSLKLLLVIPFDIDTNGRIFYEVVDKATNKRTEALFDRINLIDTIWWVRRITASYIDPERLKNHEIEFRNRLIALSTVLVLIGIVFQIVGYGVTWIPSLINITGNSSIWWLYRKGTIDNAPDIKFFSVALLYTFFLLGVPLSFIAALLGYIIPIDGVYIYSAVLVAIVLILICMILSSYLAHPFIQPRLRILWSKIRVDIQDVERKKVSLNPALEEHLGIATFLTYPRAYGIPTLMVSFSFFLVWATRFLGESWYYIIFVIPLMVIMVLLNWDYAEYYGFTEVMKKMKESGPYHVQIGNCHAEITFLGIPKERKT